MISVNIRSGQVHISLRFDLLHLILWCSFLRILSEVCGLAARFFESLNTLSLSKLEAKRKGGEDRVQEDDRGWLVAEVEEVAKVEEEASISGSNPWPVMMNEDILPEVFSKLGAEDLKNCRLVCKQWCHSASDILSAKSEVQLYTVDRYTGWEEAMENCSFDLTYARHVNHFKSFLESRDQNLEWSDRKLLRFENYRVTFATWLPEQEAVFPQNMRLFMIQHVRDSVVHLRAQGRELEWLKFALGNLPNLKTLTLDCDWYGAEGEYADGDLDNGRYPAGNFPLLPRLETLSVIEDKYFRTEMRWHWILASAPRLKNINLSLAGEPDMLLSLEKILELYRGPGLITLSVQFFEYGGGYGCFSRNSSDLAKTLQKIVNSNMGRSIQTFDCNILLSPADWTRVFTPNLVTCGSSRLEKLTISIFTGMGRAEFVEEFLVFCPTFSGRSYFGNLRYLSMKVVDSGLVGCSKEMEYSLKSSRRLPSLETLRFYYFSSVSPSKQMSGKFFEPFPNVQNITTNVDCNACVAAIFGCMPSSLRKLSLYCTLSEYMFALHDKDFAQFLQRAPALEELQLIFDSRELCDTVVADGFLKLSKLRRITFGTFPAKFSPIAWKALQDGGIQCNYVQEGRIVPLLTEAEEEYK